MFYKLATVALAAANANEAEGEQHYYDLIRDDMSDYFGERHLTNEFKEKMRQCMNKWDDEELPEALDQFWYSTTNVFQHPDLADDWVDCEEDPTNHACIFGDWTDFQMKWLEF